LRALTTDPRHSHAVLAEPKKSKRRSMKMIA
jgi:hypothetical protein